MIALVGAVLAGVADWRRTRRDDLDRVGWLDWRSVQMFALIAAALCVVAAQHG
ncbi:hypothetical protein QCD71_02280 [Sphingomonas sp. PsM26]|nr:hypothetical protein [Sphingomonas sp. PsM26]